jgi:hypothetical protein
MQTHPDNTAAKFMTELPGTIELSGDWEVALTEITYPRKSFTVRDNNTNMEIWYLNGDGKTPPDYTWTISLKEGCYESIEEVVNALNAEDDGYMSVVYTGSRILVILAEQPIRTTERYECRLTPSMQRLLGFKKNKFTLAFGDRIMGAVAPDFSEGLTTIYVYCDVIEPVVVGDCKVQLLRTLPYRHDSGIEVFNHVFTNLVYTPVQKKCFGTLEVNIMTDTGEPVPFVDGKSIAVVHFRRSSNPYFLLQK